MESIGSWEPYYAWLPVTTIGRRRVWLRRLWRRRRSCHFCGSVISVFDYALSGELT